MTRRRSIPRHKEERQRDNDICDYINRKVIYKKKKAALGRASAASKHDGQKRYIYKCPKCKFYHLTRNVQHD